MPTTVLPDATILAAWSEGNAELTASMVTKLCHPRLSVGALRHRLETLERQGLVERRRAEPHEALGSSILPWLWKLTPAGMRTREESDG